LVKKFITTFITKPLNKRATIIVNKDDIIGPRLIPKRPEFHTSDNRFKNSFMLLTLF
jgi:hypothetical protein